MKRTTRSIQIARLALASLALLGPAASAELLEPTGDTYSTLTLSKATPPAITKTSLASSTGATGTLLVSRLHHAFVQFNAGDALQLDGLTAADIASVKMTIYFPSVVKAGQINVHQVTKAWAEKFTGPAIAEPTFDSTVIVSIPAASVLAKQFVTFDVTSTVLGWLNDPATDHGFAFESPDGIVSAALTSKEGPGTGYPALLEVEIAAPPAQNVAAVNGTFSGTVGIGTTTPALPLDVAVNGQVPVQTGVGDTTSSLSLKITNSDQTGFSTVPDVAGLGFGAPDTIRQAIVGGTFGSDFLEFFTNGDLTVPKLFIDASGKTGIGTTTPSTQLEVDGTITAKPSVGNFAFVDNNESATFNFGLNSASTGLIDNTGGPIELETNGAIRMHIDQTGRVGIGTTSPTQALLVVNGTSTGSGSYTGAQDDYGSHGPVTFSTTVAQFPTSIFASSTIVANDFYAISDARSKTVLGRSDSKADLQTLRSIEITDYQFKDVIAKGNRPQKKVIAQQVEQVYPQAVTRRTDVAPDIYQKATVQEDWVNLGTDLQVGERVRLIGEKEEGIYEVLEIDDGRFRTAFRPATDTVFVFGREVNDFRTVDYEAISMLGVSATQELAKKLDEKESEIAVLRQKVTELEAQNAARDARLTRLENALEARPVQEVKASLEFK